ncbi:hypothetical protein DPMN_053754 [Dreissena polymorpha]|uniref:Uncharacterized protein n=1 Tax=Dreissena polymorpha TaxID=45954 RepID=A0A9D4HQK2_DREPO|nr:hypothetical protein DPMN_053754 [Dreissena polymorpha]
MISLVLVPSLNRIDTKYLKLINFFSLLSFEVISTLVLFVFTMIFDFSMLTFIPYATLLSESLIVRYWMEFTAGAAHEVNILRKSKVRHGSATD